MRSDYFVEGKKQGYLLLLFLLLSLVLLKLLLMKPPLNSELCSLKNAGVLLTELCWRLMHDGFVRLIDNLLYPICFL